jgi:type IV secretion system protein VirD4
MVSGHPPIKARKLRYYQDRNFTHRVLPPSHLALGAYVDRPAARMDDWSGLAMPSAPGAMSRADPTGFADEGGHQLKPELAVAFPTPHELEADDLLSLGDEDDVPLRPQDVDQQLTRAARLAALDPDDGIAL